MAIAIAIAIVMAMAMAMAMAMMVYIFIYIYASRISFQTMPNFLFKIENFNRKIKLKRKGMQ